MILRGVVITYNDMPLIQDCVESMLPYVDEIVAVDGKFKDFPGDREHSTDGTIEYLDSIDKIRLLVANNIDEVHKRNLYLVGDVGDWYLHLDADERWQGDLKIPKDADMLIARMHREKPRHYMKRIRLFKHVPGLHYEKKHYWLHDGNGNTFSVLDRPGKNYKAAETDEVKIIHYDKYRTPERKSAKKQYYRKLIKAESRYREHA